MDKAEAAPPELRPLGAAAAALWLQEPWIPAAVVAMLPQVRVAATARVPLLLTMPSGLACRRLIRAIVADTGCRHPIAVWDLAEPVPAGEVVLVDPPQWTSAAWVALECALDDTAAWLLIAVAPSTPLPPLLAGRLGLVHLRIAALCDRPLDMLPLAHAIGARLAARAGVAPPTIDAEAQAALEAYAFAGDQDELEIVVTRAFLADREVIQAAHLGLSRLPVRAPEADVIVPVPAAPSRERLEFLLAEMAHELRNPLVTIKTFADHLPALVEDAPLRDRFQALTAEAITRMETVLDNVLEFGRLGDPSRARIDLPPLLDRVLAELQPELAARSITAAREGDAHAACAGDAEQLHYALRNLLAGVAREMPPGQPLVVDARANGVVRIAFSAGGTTAARLRVLAGTTDGETLNDPTLLPLALTLARGVLERNGGHLAITGEPTGATTLVVRLPVATM